MWGCEFYFRPLLVPVLPKRLNMFTLLTAARVAGCTTADVRSGTVTKLLALARSMERAIIVVACWCDAILRTRDAILPGKRLSQGTQERTP